MLKNALLALLTLVIAIGGGAASVWAVLENGTPKSALHAGPWTAFPHTATAQKNPYFLARFAREGAITLGPGEGVVFTASNDTNGRPLTRSCTYEIAGVMPAARIWTLHAIDERGRLLPRLGRRLPGLHSRTVLYQPDDAVSIIVSAHPMPGNWLPLAGTGPMRLVLTLLDTPLATGQLMSELTFPEISRVDCNA